MSLTVQQVVTDAKNLALKLKESNTAADTLLTQVQTVHKQIDMMKQYSDDIGELNKTARHRRHSVLVAGIKQEKKHLKDLEQENKELRAALEEQQNALELIMSKYRQHVSKLVDSSKIDLPKMYNERYVETILDQALKISEMAAVMTRVSHAEENSDAIRTEEKLKQLSVENEGLREILKISASHGSEGAYREENSNQ